MLLPSFAHRSDIKIDCFTQHACIVWWSYFVDFLRPFLISFININPIRWTRQLEHSFTQVPILILQILHFSSPLILFSLLDILVSQHILVDSFIFFFNMEISSTSALFRRCVFALRTRVFIVFWLLGLFLGLLVCEFLVFWKQVWFLFFLGTK